MSHQVEANQGQEQTGYNGSLPDGEYDINCPALGMPPYKLNYLAESCETRLNSKVKRSACKFGDGCPRFRPTVATIKKPVNKRIIGPKTKHKCVCCGKVGTHQSRGLIKKCYDKHKWDKNLDQFPLNRKPRVFTEEAT